MSLFETGIRPYVDKWLLEKAAEKRDYGGYWSASSAGYCMRRNIFERLKVPYTKEDARKQRVFTAGDCFHEWLQRITKEAGLSIAQETELQDEGMMVRGHIDDLVLVHKPNIKTITETVGSGDWKYDRTRTMDLGDDQLILYDYKSVSSRSFSWAKKNGDAMSHYHKMQIGTYMYMIRSGHIGGTLSKEDEERYKLTTNLVEARILKISKDDLRMSEQQLMWSPELEKEVMGYWSTLNGYWKAKTMPKCTCADYENGFLARELYNPFFYEDEPCSLAWAKSKIDLKDWKV